MKALIIYDPQNTLLRTILPNGSGWFKKDGDEFKRQAEVCAAFYLKKGYNVEMLSIVGDSAFDKRQNLFCELRTRALSRIRYQKVICLMHGGKYNLNRKMISMSNIETFGNILHNVLDFDANIILFSCWTGAVHQGFAEKLTRITESDTIAHATRGHTTRNPYKVRITAGNALVPIFNTGLYIKGYGVRDIKTLLSLTIYSPFEFVEEVLI